MQSDAINKFAIQMNIQWAFMDLFLQVAGEIGKERHAVLSFLQKSCSTLQLRILVHVMSHNVRLLYAFSAINLQHLTAFQKGNSMIAAGWLWQTSTTISLLCLVLNPWRLSLAVGMMDSDKLTYYILPRSWCPLSSYIPSTLWSLSATRALLRALVATWSFHRQIIHQWPLDSEKKSTKRIQSTTADCKVLVARVCFHGVCPWLCANVPWHVFPILSQWRMSTKSDMMTWWHDRGSTMTSQDAPALYQLPNEICGIFALETIYLQLLVWIPSRWVTGCSLQTNLLLSVPSTCALDWI